VVIIAQWLIEPHETQLNILRKSLRTVQYISMYIGFMFIHLEPIDYTAINKQIFSFSFLYLLFINIIRLQ